MYCDMYPTFAKFLILYFISSFKFSLYTIKHIPNIQRQNFFKRLRNNETTFDTTYILPTQAPFDPLSPVSPLLPGLPGVPGRPLNPNPDAAY